MNRWADWLEQAQLNLGHAERSAAGGDYAWACFAAQQAAEAAAKAAHLRVGQVAWGHSVLDLLAGLPGRSRPPQSLLDNARALDTFYIPTRYPDAHPAGPAGRHYTAADARRAIELAREVVSYCGGEDLEG